MCTPAHKEGNSFPLSMPLYLAPELHEVDLFTRDTFGTLIRKSQNRGNPYYVIVHVISEDSEKRDHFFQHRYDAFHFFNFAEKCVVENAPYVNPSNKQKILNMQFLATELFSSKGEKLSRYEFNLFLSTKGRETFRKALEVMSEGPTVEQEGKFIAEKALRNFGAAYLKFAQQYLLDLPRESLIWKRAAAFQGNAEAQNFLGNFHSFLNPAEQNFKEAARWYSMAAHQGNANGQYSLASCYLEGQGVEKNLEQACYWFRAAASQGHSSAQYHLACCYLKGEKVEKNLQGASHWFRAAADQGDSEAQYHLGLCYFEGNGEEKSLEQAFYWFELAAKDLDANAQYRLGLCYLNGHGVAKDLGEANRLFVASAAQGCLKAKEILNVELMAKKQLEEQKKEEESKGKEEAEVKLSKESEREKEKTTVSIHAKTSVTKKISRGCCA